MSLTSTPRCVNASRAASMSVTTRCVPRYEPGAAPVMPFPMVIEHADPGGVICTTPEIVVRRMVDVEAEADLLRVERLCPIHVRDRDEHQLELEVHLAPFVEGQAKSA